MNLTVGCQNKNGAKLLEPKTWMIIQFTVVLLLFFTFQVNAKIDAQKITIVKKNIHLSEIFKSIEYQTDFLFFYDKALIQRTDLINISVKDATLEQTLRVCLKDQQLTYSIVRNTIVIQQKTFQPEIFRIVNANSISLPPPIEIKGRVVNKEGNALPDVSVLVAGTKNGTTTNSEGRFTLTVSNNVNINLEISSVGFQTKTVNVSNQTEINVTLEQDVTGLSDVVVVGYGTQRKANLTGAVDQVTSDVLENRSITNLSQGLQGVMPNLNIKLLDGKPNQSPKFNIRGATSIGQGGNALVLIDGVEGDPGLINPNDIASISVLKDAASASIYGARAVFGVVLITTKNPSKGKTNITYTGNLSIKKPTSVPDFINDGYTFAKMFAESTVNWENQFPQAINKTLKFSQAYLSELERRSSISGLPDVEIDPVTGEYVYYASTDWYRELYKTSTQAIEHNITVSGSGDKTGFLLTGRYFGQDGLFRYNSDDYRMYNFRAKGYVQVNPWLRIDNNADIANMNYHNPLNVGESGGIWRNIADEGHPLAPMFNPDGTLTASAAYSVGDFWYGKSGMDNEKNVMKNTTSFTAQFFENKFRIKGDFTFQTTDNNQKRKQVPVPYSSKPGIIAYLGTKTNDIREMRRKTNYLATNIYGEYENNLHGSHYFKFMAGYNYEQSTDKSLSASRNGLIFENAQDINLALGQSIVTTGGWEQWAVLGGFSRLNYSFKDRYLLEVNGRYDGSSKFPENQRFGFFPSFSAGWRISKESFWNVPRNIISDLKLRGSYGSLGNGNIGSYVYQEQFNVSQSGIILNGLRPSYTSRPSVLPSGLTWETSTTRNFGLDISMLSNRLSFVGDAYVRNTTDMFTIGMTLPAVFGATAPKGNYADLKTKGWEFVLSWRDKLNIKSKPFTYDIRLTLADNTAVITKYNNPENNLSDYYVGMKVGEIWGYTTEGFFSSTEDISKHASQKLFLSTSSGQIFPGDIKLRDLNGDEVISPGTNRLDDPGDRKIIGNSSPRYNYGISLGGEWSNFFFSVFFQGVGKQDWWPSTESGVFWGQYNRPYNKLPRWHMDNHWTETNPDAYLPRYVSRLANRSGGILREVQTRYLQNVAYIRLKNVQLGYTLPTNLMSKIKLNNARVYVSGENLWAWSPLYKLTRDLDVESTGPSDQEFTSGNAGDGYNYPMLKGVTFGLSVTF